MRHREQFAKSASTSRTGIFALLSGLLRAQGTATPKIALASFCALIGTLLVTAAPALAAAPEEPLIAGLESRTATTAELVGILNPAQEGNGEAGTFEFLYNKGGACEGGAKTPAAASQGEPYEYAFGNLAGLTPGGEYTACLLAENPAHQKAQSAPFAFTLPAETPETKPATPVAGTEATEATLHGVLNPKNAGEPETYEFVYQQSTSECQGGEPGEEKLASVGTENQASKFQSQSMCKR